MSDIEIPIALWGMLGGLATLLAGKLADWLLSRRRVGAEVGKMEGEATEAISAAAAAVVRELRADREDLRAEREDLRGQLAAIRVDLADCRREHDEKDAELAAIRAELADLRNLIAGQNGDREPGG